MKKLKLKINNIECLIPENYTILQACEYIGLEIPRFCYHKELLIAGNCRMCLVELEKSPKPVASCAMQIMPNMNIFTDTPLVRKAREGVLEFLLLNHPLDCPICDQGGECDLQDQSLLYGSDRSRFYDFKRSVEDKNCGPLIKTIMTRCIHCTRCVRFIDEIGGNAVLGTTNRGNGTEIGTYINKNISSELSGNLIDLCPVGALTSKPYAFKGRSWELKNKNTIDIFDGLGTNTVTQIRGQEIMRVVPGINHDINKEWISDKVRYFFDGLKYQRITSPILQNNETNSNWKEVLNLVKKLLQTSKEIETYGVVGKLTNIENTYMFKKFLTHFSNHNTKIVNETYVNNLTFNFSDEFTFKNSLTDFSSNDLCVLIGTNLKTESPVLNSHLKKRYMQGNFEVYHLGANDQQTFPVIQCGFNLIDLIKIVEGRHYLSKKISQSTNPIFIINNTVFNNTDNELIKNLLNILKNQCKRKFKNWNNFNFLSNYANLNLHHELNFNKKIPASDNKKIIFLFNTDNFNLNKLKKNSIIIYCGHHGTQNAVEADLILPINLFTEESGLYLNSENRVQNSEQVVSKLFGKPAWALFGMLSDLSYKANKVIDLKYTEKTKLKKTILKDFGVKLNIKTNSKFYNKNIKFNKVKINKFKYILKSNVENFYLNDPITKNSIVLSKSSITLRNKKNFI